MRFDEVQLPATSESKGRPKYIGDIFDELQASGFRYVTMGCDVSDEDLPDDELIENYREQIEKLMIEDNYENIEVIELKNYSARTGSKVYKSNRDVFETRLITHGQCSLFVNINDKLFELQCNQGDVIRIPASIPYWLEVGVHACRYIHLFMTEAGWDKPVETRDKDFSQELTHGRLAS